MKRFDYIRAASASEAIAAAAQPNSVYLAGGTNLLDLMKIGVARPDRVIDISRIKGLGEITWQDDGGVRIGALVRNADLAYDGRFAKTFPSVAEALLSGASAQVRNAASVGGNLMQHTRCAYFHDPASACNRRVAGSGCDAREGENRLHAVLGWSEHCIATHPSDFCVPLVAFDASVEVEGPHGSRDIKLWDFYSLPGSTPDQVTALQPGELIVAVKIPAASAAFAPNARYLKLRERTSFAFAVVSCAAALQIDGGMIQSARIALGGVAARPWRCQGAEAAVIGVEPGREAFEKAASLALADARPSGDNAFKIELARRIILRTLTLAMEGTPETMPALPASPFPSESGARHVA
ncbi:MAG: xanthine dehydrogenase family protein subunit M [Rhizobiaceae bacterium]